MRRLDYCLMPATAKILKSAYLSPIASAALASGELYHAFALAMSGKRMMTTRSPGRDPRNDVGLPSSTTYIPPCSSIALMVLRKKLPDIAFFIFVLVFEGHFNNDITGRIIAIRLGLSLETANCYGTEPETNNDSPGE